MAPSQTKELLSMQKNKADVVFQKETHFQKRSVPKLSFFFFFQFENVYSKNIPIVQKWIETMREAGTAQRVIAI